MDKIAVFSGNANLELANDICKFLKIKLSDAFVSRFSEGEIRVKINENVRGKDVFIVQPTCPPPNENLMELLLLPLIYTLGVVTADTLTPGVKPELAAPAWCVASYN